MLRVDNFHVHDTISNIETTSQHISILTCPYGPTVAASLTFGARRVCLMIHGRTAIMGYTMRHPRSVSERPFALSIPSHSDCIFLLGKRNIAAMVVCVHTGIQVAFSEIGAHFQGAQGIQAIPQSCVLLCTVHLSPVPH